MQRSETKAYGGAAAGSPRQPAATWRTTFRSSLFALLLVAVPATADRGIAVIGKALSARGTAVPGAIVQVFLADRRDDGPAQALGSVLTGLDGGFRMEVQQPGIYVLRIHAGGFAPVELRLEPLVEATRLPPAVLAEDMGQSVRLVDAMGRSVAGARISAVPSPASRGERSAWSLAASSGRTGEDGGVRLARARGSELLLLAFRADLGESRFEISEPEGGESPVLLHLRPARRRVIAVLDRGGEPLPGALVRLGQGGWLAGRTAEDGRAVVAVPARGRMEVEIEAPDGGHARQFLLPGESTAFFTPEPPEAVAGWVTRHDGHPVAGALVWPAADASRAVRTDGAGRFLLSVDGRCGREVHAAAAGFLAAHRPLCDLGSGPAPAAAAVPHSPQGRRPASLVIVLRPGRPVFGTLLEGEQRPVEAARVVLSLPAAPSGPWREARSEGGGTFLFEDVPAGTVALEVQAAGFAPLRLSDLVIPAGSEPWDLGALTLTAAVSVAGSVVDRRGEAVSGAAVRFMRAEEDADAAGLPAGPLQTTTDAAGRFVASGLLPRQRLDLEVTREGFARAQIDKVQVPLDEPLIIVLAPGASLSGSSLGRDGEAVAGATVTVRQDAAARGQSLGPPKVFQAVSDEDGHFTLEHLEPGSLFVSAFAERYQESQEMRLELGEAGVDGLQIVLDRGATVGGWVRSAEGTAIAGARVEAYPTSREPLPRAMPRRATTADTGGAYRLEGLAPGEWIVAASHPRYLRGAERLEVRAEGQALDLVLALGAEVSGQVVNGGGAPVPGARVTLRALGEPAAGGAELPPVPTPDTLSDSAGRFRFAGVENGSYRLRAQRSGFAVAELTDPVEVHNAPLAGLLVRLDQGSSIAGRLLGLDARDLARVEVVAIQGSETTARGQVDPGGRYRLRDLAAGEWTVAASIAGGGRRAVERATVGPSLEPVLLDLDLTGGADE